MFRVPELHLPLQEKKPFYLFIKLLKIAGMLKTEELLKLNHLGLIPGPNEKEDEFQQRCRYCLDLKKTITEKIPFSAEEVSSAEIYKIPLQKTTALFDIAPSWIPLFFSNHRLTPWHGGSLWIFQVDENSPPGAFFQLRQVFRHSTTYLGIYQRDEVIAHEFSHAGRMKYEEPQFEEVLAYRTSQSKWRRYLGPLVQAPWESALFALSLLLIFLLDLYFIMLGSHELYRTVQWLKLLPLLLLFFGFSRAFLRQKQLQKCLKKLNDAVSSEEKANAILYRLQDKEIKQFGKMTGSEIWKYMIQNKDHSLRWKVISEAYFKG